MLFFVRLLSGNGTLGNGHPHVLRMLLYTSLEREREQGRRGNNTIYGSALTVTATGVPAKLVILQPAVSRMTNQPSLFHADGITCRPTITLKQRVESACRRYWWPRLPTPVGVLVKLPESYSVLKLGGPTSNGALVSHTLYVPSCQQDGAFLSHADVTAR